MSTLMTQARSRVPRFAEAAVERARLTVVPRQAQKAPKVPFVTLVSLLLVAGVVGLLLFNTHMQQASFTTTALEERATLLDAKEQALQMELDTLRDPQRVAARAQALGMVPPSAPAFLRLSDGKVLGNPEVATSANTVRIAPLPTPKPKSLRPDPVILPAENATTTTLSPEEDQVSPEDVGADTPEAHGHGSGR
ncbi:MAG: hypothetical protein ACRDPJ_01345 [Nocardioidaceae bacterium]